VISQKECPISPKVTERLASTDVKQLGMLSLVFNTMVNVGVETNMASTERPPGAIATEEAGHSEHGNNVSTN